MAALRRSELALIALAIACDDKPAPSATAAPTTPIETPPSPASPPSPPSPSSLVAGHAELDELLEAIGAELEVASDKLAIIETSPCAVTQEQGCMRCELAPRTAVPPLEVVTALRIAPVSFLEAAGIKRVQICGKLEYLGDHGAAPIGSVDFARGTLILQTLALKGNARSVIQHEIFHLFDVREPTRDRAWLALNPKGFRYGTPSSAGGFAAPYGMTNVREDKATIYEAIIKKDLCRLAETDRIVLAKGRLVRKRIHAAIGDDVKFVDELAPCLAR